MATRDGRRTTAWVRASKIKTFIVPQMNSLIELVRTSRTTRSESLSLGSLLNRYLSTSSPSIRRSQGLKSAPCPAASSPSASKCQDQGTNQRPTWESSAAPHPSEISRTLKTLMRSSLMPRLVTLKTFDLLKRKSIRNFFLVSLLIHLF